MSYLLFKPAEIGFNLFVNGKMTHGSDVGLGGEFEPLMITSRALKLMCYRIPHPEIFLLSTVSLSDELVTTSRPKIELPMTMPMTKGIVVWAKENPTELAVYDAHGLHELIMGIPYLLADVEIGLGNPKID